MKTILIVEDELSIADMLCSVLEDEGYQCVVARHGKEGLEKLGRQIPDLILCDVMMPILDGREFYRHVQAHEAYRSIPFVFMSAVAHTLEIEAFHYAALIPKPFQLKTLLQTVELVLASA